MAPKAPKWLRRATSLRGGAVEADGPPPPPEAAEAFAALVEAEGVGGALAAHARLMAALDMQPGPHSQFWPRLKSALKERVPFRHREIFKILSTKAKEKPYHGYPATDRHVLVAGAGNNHIRSVD